MMTVGGGAAAASTRTKGAKPVGVAAPPGAAASASTAATSSAAASGHSAVPGVMARAPTSRPAWNTRGPGCPPAVTSTTGTALEALSAAATPANDGARYWRGSVMVAAWLQGANGGAGA